MKILVVVATELEGQLLADELTLEKKIDKNIKRFSLVPLEIDILTTGVGVIFTSYHLTRVLQCESYDLVLNIGLARSFSTKMELGQVYNIVTEEFADPGC